MAGKRIAGCVGNLLGRWRGAMTGCAVVLLALVLALSPALSAGGPMLAHPAETDAGKPSARAEADADMVAHVAALRQLSLEPVPVESMTQDELRAMLTEDSEDDLAEMAVTQDLFIFLDFLDEGDNLYDIWMEAYTQEILGFYDDEKGELCLIGGSAAPVDPMDKLTLAHEYAHALQDQHFDLSALMEDDGDSEASAARQALVEGDAMLVMVLYLTRYLTEEEQAAFGEMATAPGAVPDIEMPPIVEETMTFPYEYGLDFVLTVFREDQGGWHAVNDAYSDPPVSTEQIMHPRKYLRQNDDPVEVTLPDMAAALGPGWTEPESDVFGEFYLKLFLEAFVDEGDASTAAAGWGGDRYSFLENEAGANVFVLSTKWDSADDAREFYDSCADRCATRGGSGREGDAVGSRTSGEWEGGGQNCRFALDGDSVYLVMASDAETAGRAMSVVYQSGGSSKLWLWVGLGGGLAFLACIVGVGVLLFRRRWLAMPAVGPAVPPGSPPAPLQ